MFHSEWEQIITRIDFLWALSTEVYIWNKALNPKEVLNKYNSMLVHNINTDEHFSTIQSALDDPDTLDGHTIYVLSGTYNEHITITKSVTLTGEDRDTTIIDGDGSGEVVTIKCRLGKCNRIHYYRQWWLCCGI